MKATLLSSSCATGNEPIPRAAQSASLDSSFDAELKTACGDRVSPGDKNHSDTPDVSSPEEAARIGRKEPKRGVEEMAQDASPLLVALLAVPPPLTDAAMRAGSPNSADQGAGVDSSPTLVGGIQSNREPSGSGSANHASLLTTALGLAETDLVPLRDQAVAASDSAGDASQGDTLVVPPDVQDLPASEGVEKTGQVEQHREAARVASTETEAATGDARTIIRSTFFPEGAFAAPKANSGGMDGTFLAHSGAVVAGNTVVDVGPLTIPVTSSATSTPASVLGERPGSAKLQSFARKNGAGSEDMQNAAAAEGGITDPTHISELKPVAANASHSDAQDGANADVDDAAGAATGSAFTTSSAGAPPLGIAGTTLQPASSTPREESSSSAHHAASEASSSAACDSDRLKPSPFSSLQSAQLLRRVEHAEIRIGVNGETFGPIRMQTSLEADRVGASIDTSHPALRAALMTEAGTLEKAMAQHRLQLQVLDVGGGHAQSNSGGFADHRHEPQPKNSALPQWPAPLRQTATQAPLGAAATVTNNYRLDVRA